MSKKQRIQQHYEPRITPGRPNYDVLDWANPTSQQARFVVLADNVDLAGRSLLDVGCGLGDLLAFLKQRRVEVDYTGVDLIERMVQAARQQHGDATFVQADVFRADPFDGRRFDVVFCSGALNLNLGNNREFLPVAVEQLLTFANDQVVFNLLHARSSYKEPAYAYHDPADVLRRLAHLPCSMHIRDDYLPNDFTVFCRKTPAEDTRT